MFASKAKLGMKKAKMILEAMGTDDRNFGYVKVREEELASLTPVAGPSGLAYHSDMYVFAAGNRLITIVDEESYLMVNLIDPRNPKEVNTVYAMEKE